MVVPGLIYLLFSIVVTLLLKNKKTGFLATFLITLIFTPLLVAVVGLFLSRDLTES
jgi:hypothetical protein